MRQRRIRARQRTTGLPKCNSHAVLPKCKFGDQLKQIDERVGRDLDKFVDGAIRERIVSEPAFAQMDCRPSCDYPKALPLLARTLTGEFLVDPGFPTRDTVCIRMDRVTR